jgi:hypothetical protein
MTVITNLRTRSGGYEGEYGVGREWSTKGVRRGIRCVKGLEQLEAEQTEQREYNKIATSFIDISIPP